MALPVRKAEMGIPVDDKSEIMLTHIEHILTDISDIKADVRRLNDRLDNTDRKHTERYESLDQKFSQKLESLEQKFSGKLENLDQKFSEKFESLRDLMEKGFVDLRMGRLIDRVWYLLMSAAILGIVARALKWF